MSVAIKVASLKNHLIQPTVIINDKLSFDLCKIYYQTISNTEKVPRKWLSYCSFNQKLYCTLHYSFDI